MLQVVNRTPFVANILLFPNENGIDTVYTVIKGRFQLQPLLSVADKQSPLVLADIFQGEPGTSSLKRASEATLLKPSTDVYLLGHAYAPGGRPAREIDVTARVGPLKKTVRVFGDRVWKRGVLSPSPSAPEAFEMIPLVYERAFGGMDESRAGEGILDAEVRNPVGVGYRSKKSEKEIDGTPLPNLEDPDDLISHPRNRPAPAGFGPVCGHWEPRRSFAGTYDEAWQNKRAPYLPVDFDSRFFNSASAGLVASAYLTGGEEVEVLNATPSGHLSFKLPIVQLHTTYRIAGENREEMPVLESVALAPDENELTMTWRAGVECDKKTLKVRQVDVECDGMRMG